MDMRKRFAGGVAWHDLTAALCALAIDDDGQDMVEYALLSGIVGVASLAFFQLIQERMRTSYVNWHAAANVISEPCAPAPAACP